MRAVAILREGGPAELTDLPEPTPGPDEFRVRLEAAGVNPVDAKMASGAYGAVELPFIVGVDGAGVVDMVGEQVDTFSVGQRVFGRLGQMGHGTYAEYCVVPRDAVVTTIPDGLISAAAAVIPVAGTTALGVLRALGPSSGDRLLILGATGGVGTFLVQLAAKAGAKVIATARPEWAELTRRQGAVATIDHTAPESLLDQLRTLGIDELDRLVDLVGIRTVTDQLGQLVRAGGTAVSTVRGGIDPENPPRKDIGAVVYRGQGTPAMLDELAAMVQAREIVVPIRELPLEDGPRAFDESKSGHLHGKTALRIRSLQA